MGDDLSKEEQDEIVGEIVVNLEQMDEDELEELYDQLDADHQEQVDGSIRAFADNAVGDEHWDSDS